MEDKFYTIDKIAELLGMHHKPTRQFIESILSTISMLLGGR